QWFNVDLYNICHPLRWLAPLLSPTPVGTGLSTVAKFPWHHVPPNHHWENAGRTLPAPWPRIALGDQITSLGYWWCLDQSPLHTASYFYPSLGLAIHGCLGYKLPWRCAKFVAWCQLVAASYGALTTIRNRMFFVLA